MAAPRSEAPVVSWGLAEPLRLPPSYICRRTHLPLVVRPWTVAGTQARPVSSASSLGTRRSPCSAVLETRVVSGAPCFSGSICSAALVQSVLCISCFLGLRLRKEPDRHGPLVRVRRPDPADSSPESLELVCAHLLSCSCVRPGLSVSPGLRGEPADGFPACPLVSCFLCPQPRVLNAPHFPENPLSSPFPALHSALSAALLVPPSLSLVTPCLHVPSLAVSPLGLRPFQASGPSAPRGGFPALSPASCASLLPWCHTACPSGASCVRSYSFLFNWLSSLQQTLRSEGPGTMPDLFTTVLTASTIRSIKLQTVGLAIYSGNS